MADIVAAGRREREAREAAEFEQAMDDWLAAHPGQALPDDFVDLWEQDRRDS